MHNLNLVDMNLSNNPFFLIEFSRVRFSFFVFRKEEGGKKRKKNIIIIKKKFPLSILVQKNK